MTDAKKHTGRRTLKPIFAFCFGVLIGLLVLLPVLYTHTKTVTITYGCNPQEFADISGALLDIPHCMVTELNNNQSVHNFAESTICLTTIQVKIHNCFNAQSTVEDALNKVGIPNIAYNIKVSFF